MHMLSLLLYCLYIQCTHATVVTMNDITGMTNHYDLGMTAYGEAREKLNWCGKI